MPNSKTDRSLLEAALVGFGHKLGEVTLAIADIKRSLGIAKPAERPANAGGQRKRKPMSAAARARIAAAQRKRWAAVKRQKGQTASLAKQSVPRKPKAN